MANHSECSTQAHATTLVHMTHLNDEFRFLNSDALRVAREKPLPEVKRVQVAVSDGRKISALQYEPSKSPAFVFLHGMGLNAHSFDPVVLALDAPALALDLPGHGRSDWREDANYRPDFLAQDVLLALAQLAPEPFVFVGHSLGGLTAAIAAPALGKQLRGLVILDITPALKPQSDGADIGDFISGQRDFKTQEEMVDRAIQFGIGEDRAALTRGVALNVRQHPDGRWEWAHHFAHMEAQPMQSLGEGSPFAPIWAALEAVHVGGTKVALIRGSEGLVDDSQITEWRKRMPTAEVLTIQGPHNLHEASPAELAKSLSCLDYS